MPRIELSELERQKLAKAGADSIPHRRGWRPIETIPRDETLVLLHKDKHVCIGHYWEKYDACYAIIYGGPPLYYATDWQPLPEPPLE
jgi:hypothetical protein